MTKLFSSSLVFFLLWLTGQWGALAQSTTLATDGVYVPRLTTTQRDSIISPTPGQMVYNTDANCFNVYQKNTWQELCGFDMILSDSWIRKADLPGGERHGAVGFTIGNKGYIGTGFTESEQNFAKDFWEYNPLTDSWTQMADFEGVGRVLAVGFAINNKGYIATGLDNDGYDLKDFWEYNPEVNEWIKKTDFGGEARSRASSFSIDNKGYIGIGKNNNNIALRDFWEYNPTNDTWIKKKNFAGKARFEATSFSIGNRGYIGNGNNYDSYNNFMKDFWEYNPTNDKWIQKADFAGMARAGAVGFSIDNKGYIGSGHTSLGFSNNIKDFWEYDPTSMLNGKSEDGMPKGNWVQKKDIGPGPTTLTVGFSINGKGYVGTGLDANGFWEYNIDAPNVTQQGNIFNGNNQLVKTDALGKISTSVLPTSATIQGNTFNQANQLVKLDASGFLGVGITTPKAQIHLYNSVANRKIILWQNADDDHQFYGLGVNDGILRYQIEHTSSAHVFYVATNATSSRELFRIRGTGAATLNGNMSATGFTNTSDIRFKRNFSSIATPLDKVLQMNGFHYYWKTEQFKEKNFPESRQIGFIAQEVEALFPELVNTDDNGYKSVDYARLTPILVEAIKELKKENDAIRKDVEALKNIVSQAQNGK